MTDQLCAAWASTAHLPGSSTLPPLSPDEWTDLLWQASEVLYAYSGRQWTGAGCTSSVQFGPVRPGICAWVPEGVAWPLPELLGIPTGVAIWTVRLPVAPVTAVTAVLVDGDAYGGAWSVHLPSGTLTAESRPWPTDGSLTVTFTYGVPPPRGGRAAAVELAVEWAKAMTGDKTCRLPANTQTVAREGVTITVASKADSSGQFRTGLARVDTWLDSVNPYKMTRRPSVWTPDIPLGTRVSRP